jgi:pimeloyl-ACP methyl ester carboxylesterase
MRNVVVWGVVVIVLAAAASWLWTPDKPREPLEARYAAPPSRFVEVAGLRLHVRETGPPTAAAVILMHGFGASLHTWEDWARGLESDWRVIRFDLPGAGLTGPDPTADYRDERGEQILLALMDQLGLARASVVGHSMGGRLAWRFAADHPDRVTRLVLVAPDGFASPGFEYDKPPEVPAALELMRHALPRALMRMNLEPAYANPQALTDETIDRYHDLLLAPGVRGALLDRLKQTRLRDPLPLLARIQAPTLLIWGEQDAMIPLSNSTDYLKAVAGARLVSLPGVGHLPQEERPDAALEALRQFLRE